MTLASTVTDASLLEFAPALSSLTEAVRLATIDRAEARVDASYFGDLYGYAWLLMAAHMGTLQTQSATATSGMVSGKKAGDLDISFDTSASGRIPSQYLGTRYGVELWGLIEENSYKASFTVI